MTLSAGIKAHGTKLRSVLSPNDPIGQLMQMVAKLRRRQIDEASASLVREFLRAVSSIIQGSRFLQERK